MCRVDFCDDQSSEATGYTSYFETSMHHVAIRIIRLWFGPAGKRVHYTTSTAMLLLFRPLGGGLDIGSVHYT